MSNDKVKQKAPERVWLLLNQEGRWISTTPEAAQYVGGAEYARADLLATVRKEALKEAMAIIDRAGEEWGDAARARRSQTYSAYVIAALDLKGRIEGALEASANSEKQVNEDDHRCYNKGGAL